MEKEVELKQLHNMLDRILEKKPFLNELKSIFHEIIDDIWNQNQEYIQMTSQLSISKTEYIYRYIKAISDIKVLKKEYLPNGLPAMIQYIDEEIILTLSTNKYNEDVLLKTCISHELGHVPYMPAQKYYFTIGGWIIRYVIDEGIAEENAKNNPNSKPKDIEFKFEYSTEDDMIYTCNVPNTGFTSDYSILSNFFAQFRAILPEKEFEEIKKAPIGDLDIFIIKRINNQMQDKNLCESYIKRIISVFNRIYPQYRESTQGAEKYINENGIIVLDDNYFSQNRDTLNKEADAKIDFYTKWNKEVHDFMVENTNFEQNFIQIQRDFFSIMSAKVKMAQNIEEVLKIVGDMEYYKNNMPRIINQRGEDRTKSQIGIFGFERAVADRINDLQLEGKCSALTNSTNTAGDEPDL